MKKLGKKLNFANETLSAYCGCACVTGCTTKCLCDPTSTTAYTNLTNTNVTNVYSNIGSAAK